MKYLVLFLAFLALYGPVIAGDAGESVFIEEAGDRTIVIWKDVTIPEGKSYETVVIMNGRVEFFATTENLILVNGEVILGEGSEVDEKLVIINGKIEKSENALIPEEGPTSGWFDSMEFDMDWNWAKEFGMISKLGDFASNFLWFPLVIAIPIAILILLFGLALVFFAIAPSLAEMSDKTLQVHPIASLGWGALAHLAFVPIIVLLSVSIVGIPFIPLFVLLMMLILLAGFFLASKTVGRFLLSKIGIGETVFSTLLGIFLIFGVSFAPFIGRLVVVALVMAGAGAVIQSMFGIRSQNLTY